MDCLQCGKVFFGTNTKFCSMKCYKDHINDEEERINEEQERINEARKEELSRKKDQ